MTVMNCFIVFVDGNVDRLVCTAHARTHSNNHTHVCAHVRSLTHEPMHARTLACTHARPHARRPSRLTAQVPLAVQLMGSLLVSVLLLGFKLTSFKEIVSTVERAKELKVNVALLQKQLEAEELALWLADVAYDTKRRTDTILAIESGEGPCCDTAEDEAISKSLETFALFEASSSIPVIIKHAATIDRAEAKHVKGSGHLLVRSEALIRGVTPPQLVAFTLNFDSRYTMSTLTPDVDVRHEIIETRSAHHTVGFYRWRLPGVSDRTFLMSFIAKKVKDAPVTYVLAVVPLPRHGLVTAKDEAGAVRAECHRTWRFIEEGPGLTRVVRCNVLRCATSVAQFRRRV